MTIASYLENRTAVTVNDVLAYEQDNGDMFASRDSVVEAIKAAGWFVDAGKNNAVKNQPENIELRARATPAPKPARVDSGKSTGVQVRWPQKPASTKPQAKVRRPQKAPVSKRGEVTATTDQNDHMWAILNDRELTAAQVGVATRMHYYAFTSRPGDKAGACTRAIPTMAAHCNMSLNTFKDAAKVLVERGYFIRDDDGKGGARGNGKACWTPALPSWWGEGV